MKKLPQRSVIISNGFNKFHLAVAAAAMERGGYLQTFITGAYPYGVLRRVSLGRSFGGARWRKFCDRKEDIDENHIDSYFSVEAFYLLQLFFRRLWRWDAVGDWIDRTSYRLYGWRTANSILANGGDARIFHYRSGFGLSAAVAARARGMALLCDHSIAHPQLLDVLIRQKGQLRLDCGRFDTPLFWRGAMEDIKRADMVVVNSDFVRDTFLRAGYPSERLEVVYWGTDDNFYREIPLRRHESGLDEPLRFLYAGMFERRKGCEILLDAFSDDLPGKWVLHVAGPIARDLRAQAEALFRRPNVVAHNAMRRAELAALMAECDVLVFPSFAEGSARVVFEAMACGCAVVTTPNAGSVVRHGEHGWIVEPGDAMGLRSALVDALNRRAFVAAAGAKGAHLVATNFRQQHYSEHLLAVYSRLFAQTQETRSVNV